MPRPEYYETDAAVAEYLLFPYGPSEQVLPWNPGPREALDYPVRCVSEMLEPARLPSRARALDLGCAVGRSTFELTRHCVEVTGIDQSRHFIEVACRLQADGSVPFDYVEEGELRASATAVVPPELDRSRVRFMTGDAEALEPGLGSFDVVLLANVVDRLEHPRRCLEALRGLVRTRGQLILTTPCTWLEAYTPRAQWPGGFERDGRPVRTLDTLRSLLEAEFSLHCVKDMPFLIREHARKYQWSVALGTSWIRR